MLKHQKPLLLTLILGGTTLVSERKIIKPTQQPHVILTLLGYLSVERLITKFNVYLLHGVVYTYQTYTFTGNKLCRATLALHGKVLIQKEVKLILYTGA